MKELLYRDPQLFMEYASMDSVVTLLYLSSMYGYNNQPAITITSAAAKVMKENMMKTLGCLNTEEFNLKYRGLQKVNHGKVKMENRAGFIENTSLEPISDIANTIQYYTSHAYHGGYNICTKVGYFPYRTYDYDLKNAYPTAMCLVPDIDWTNPVRNEIIRQYLDIRLWKEIGGFNPILPFVGYVRFEFPDDVLYPCIPITCDGIPVYPLTSEGVDGVYAAGPFIYLALRLGAKVYCERGFFLNPIIDENGEESHALGSAVKQLVVDRERAKRECGKNSMEELTLKTMVNSGYGKNAQNVIQKTSWSAYQNEMVTLGCSAITNPVSAMMTTSIIQAVLIAAQNQIRDLGHMSCSVTTDGFISDCPKDLLANLDLYGFNKYLEVARLYLTNNPQVWEVKHYQDDLINFTTRGNVSLLSHGVCAHNSAKSPYDSDTYEDRLWLVRNVVSRTGKIESFEKEFTTFKELVKGANLNVKEVVRHLSMDFDLKRKPDRNSFKSNVVQIENESYEIACFDTLPYKNLAEFRLYREKAQLVDVLRTINDWNLFFQKIDLNSCGAKVRNMEWSIIMTCVMGHRSNQWIIPKLNEGTVEDKCIFINEHNDSGKEFKPSDWKNANRPERIANMLPKEFVVEKLHEMQGI